MSKQRINPFRVIARVERSGTSEKRFEASVDRAASGLPDVLCVVDLLLDVAVHAVAADTCDAVRHPLRMDLVAMALRKELEVWVGRNLWDQARTGLLRGGSHGAGCDE